MRSQPPEFANVVLDSLTAHIAVLDVEGVIIGVNQAWRRFAEQNQGESCGAYVGLNYLDVCERAAHLGGEQTARDLLEGLRAVLRGERDNYLLEYPCNSPDEERWYIVRVSRCQQRGESWVVVAHEDITARKKAELALARTEQTLRKTLDALPVGVWLMDSAGQILQGNAAGQRIWAGARYVPPEQFGEYRGWWLDSGEPIAADEWAAARAIRQGETSIDEEIAIECFDGSRKIILNSAIPLHEDDGRISGAIIVNQDISARHQADEELRRAKLALELANRELQLALSREQDAARTDELTGLCNRRHFFDLAKQLFEVARRYRQPLSAVMLDLDHFKRINDRYGHQAGDEVLRLLTRTVAPHLRAADIFARYGGEEFVLLLPDTDPQYARGLVERIRLAVAGQRLETGGGAVLVTLSAGIAAMADDDECIEAMIRRADQALYAAKAGGRNRALIYSPAAAQNTLAT
jgi:diguanylate cyclase (GGDEF)-like protein